MSLVAAHRSNVLRKEAWESHWSTTIDEFKTPENKTTQAHQSIWLDNLPPVLFFQLNRVYFESGDLRKTLERFEFDKVIYPDRFFIKNRKESEKLRRIAKDLRDKCDYLEECINRFKKYRDEPEELSNILGKTMHFLNSQLTSMQE